MITHVTKTQEKKKKPVANAGSKNQHARWSDLRFAENRPEVVAQRKLQEMANNSPQAMQLKAIQDIANNSFEAKQATQLMSSGCSVAQLAKMSGSGAFPAVTENIQTGNSVFKDGGLDHLNVSILGEDTKLFVGQDYLNTDLSQTYKEKPDQIKSGDAKVYLDETGKTDEEEAAVVDGHHRVIWKLYHGQQPDWKQIQIGVKIKPGGMTYKDTPAPVLLPAPKKGEDHPYGSKEHGPIM